MVRVHVPSLPHTDTTRDWATCAYSSKWLRLPTMLNQHGHDTILYGSERDESEATEHVVVVTDADRKRWFGDTDWRQKVFDRWEPTDPCWTEMNQSVIAAMRARWQPGDIVGITMGRCQQSIADAFPGTVIAELGCGYDGILANSHVAFESHAWRHYVYGRRGIADGRFYDAVIPNAFDPADFRTDLERDDYLLYLGRLTPRKGLAIVAELAKKHRVVTAGQGEPLDGIEHRGIVIGAEKAELLGRARGLLSPSQYLEPFGGVAVEAQMSGTPVIATPFGAYPETIVHGTTGFLCSTLAEFHDAANRVDELHHGAIAAIARRRFSLDAVAPLYDRWLTNLATLYEDGWYSVSPT